MTWNPILPVWAVVIIVLALGALCVVALVRAPDRARRRDWAVRAFVVLLLGIACLRPGIGTSSAATATNDVDVFFVVDTTASMNAEDWDGAPRLDGVRGDVMALAEAHAGARFSLLTFDSEAQLRVPLTTDVSALQSAVTTLRPEITGYSSGSSISAANELLEETLERAADAKPERARVVYYLGDGEQTAREDPESFASSAELLQGGAVLGYGTDQGGPMRETLSGFATTEPTYIVDRSTGSDAISRIDEPALETIASQLGVGYQHRTPATAVQAAAVDPTVLETETGNDVERAFDLYWIFAIVIFLLLLREVWVLTRAIIELSESRGARA